MSRLPPASAEDPTGQGRHLTVPATSGGRGAHPQVPLGRTSSLGWSRRRASCLFLRPPSRRAGHSCPRRREAAVEPRGSPVALPPSGPLTPSGDPCPAPRCAALLPRPPAGRSAFVIPVVVPLSAVLEYGPFLTSPPAGVLQLSFHATAVFGDL